MCQLLFYACLWHPIYSRSDFVTLNNQVNQIILLQKQNKKSKLATLYKPRFYFLLKRANLSDGFITSSFGHHNFFDNKDVKLALNEMIKIMKPNSGR
jgi:hypothetical protein